MRGLPKSFAAGAPVRVAKFPGIVATFKSYTHSGFCTVTMPSGAVVAVSLADVDDAPKQAQYFPPITSEDFLR